MSKHQRETIDWMLRDAPFDLGGDVLVQRPLLEQMLTGHRLAHDVRTTSGELGGMSMRERAQPLKADPSNVMALIDRLGARFRRMPPAPERSAHQTPGADCGRRTVARAPVLGSARGGGAHRARSARIA